MMLISPLISKADTFLDNTIKGANVSLDASQLGAIFRSEGIQAVRTQTGMQPRSDIRYIEVIDNVGSSYAGLAIGPAGLPLDDSIVTDTRALIKTNNPQTIGLAIDYRRNYPVLHIIETIQGTTEVNSIALENIHTTIYVYLFSANNQTGTADLSVNLGNTNAPAFTFNAAAELDQRYYRGGENIINQWYDPNCPAPTLTLAAKNFITVQNTNTQISASATDGLNRDISNQINWSISDLNITQTGPTLSFVPSPLGEYQIDVEISGCNNQTTTQTASVNIITDASIDSDADGLTFQQEIAQTTDPAQADSDNDNLSDGLEILSQYTNPKLADTDGDRVPDGFEILHLLNPTINDANLDKDKDGYSNYIEFKYKTDPNLNTSYPFATDVRLNDQDSSPGTYSTSKGKSVVFRNANSGIRSNTSIEPRSGWSYFEGKRLSATGSYGFGLATKSAPLNQAGGTNNLSFGVNTLGDIRYNNSIVDNILEPGVTEYYGLVVDYSGNTPNIYVITECTPSKDTHPNINEPNDGDFCVPLANSTFPISNSAEPVQITGPIAMTGASGQALYIFVYSQAAVTTPVHEINAGDDPSKPQHFKANYVLFNHGVQDARYISDTWGQPYTSPQKLPAKKRVQLEITDRTNWGIKLSDDGLSASFADNFKSAILANQAMIKEFRYFEVQRLIDPPIDSGIGLINQNAQINPLPYRPSPPHVSLNIFAGIWRNLNFQRSYNTGTFFYGFAVDYREEHPIVHFIIDDVVETSIRLDDMFLPIYPMLYGDGSGIPELITRINFGEDSFYYNPQEILFNHGIDTDGFELGWGNQTQPGPNQPPLITALSSHTNAKPGEPITLSGSASDPEQGDISGLIRWTGNGQVIGYGPNITYKAPQATQLSIVATVYDNHGLQNSFDLNVSVQGQADTDLDGLDDQAEAAAKTNPNEADSDKDGLTDAEEINIHQTNPLSSDSDSDTIPDNEELKYGLNPNADDSTQDLDLDSFTNLFEYQNLTHPNDNISRPEPVTWNNSDKGSQVSLDSQQLQASFPSDQWQGIRSSQHIFPGQNPLYFEIKRLCTTDCAGNLIFGLTTESIATETTYTSTQTLAVTHTHVVYGLEEYIHDISGPNEDVGFIVDYRTDLPIIYMIGTPIGSTTPKLYPPIYLNGVTAPLYIYAAGRSLSQAGVELKMNHSFTYNPKQLLQAANLDALAQQLQVGWPKGTTPPPSNNTDAGVTDIASASTDGGQTSSDSGNSDAAFSDTGSAQTDAGEPQADTRTRHNNSNDSGGCNNSGHSQNLWVIMLVLFAWFINRSQNPVR